MGSRARIAAAAGVVLLATFAAASPAWAEETGPSLADNLTGIAKAEYVAGRTLFNDGDFAGALVKFKSALETSKDARLLWNLGACERGLRHYAESIRDFERYKTEAAQRLTDQDRADADTIISGLRPFVASVSVNANEEGASVLVDERELGKTPLAGTLVDLGPHRLVVRKSGFKDYSAPLSVTGNAEIIRDVRLDPAAHEGKLAIHTGPNDAISVDGKSVAMGEYAATVPSGEHLVRVTSQGKKPYEMRVLVSDDQLRSVDVSLEKEGSLPLWAWLGLGGVAAAGVSLATYFALKPKSDVASPVAGSIPPGLVQLPARDWR